MWAECGISYYGFSHRDFENEKCYWKDVDLELCNLPISILLDKEKISTYPQLLDFLIQKSAENEDKIEIPDELMGLELTKKLTFLPPAPKSPVKTITYRNREYSKRLKETPLDNETKRSILDQIENQTGIDFYGLTIKDLKKKASWAWARKNSHIKINFVSGLSSATYKFNRLVDLIDFLCAIDCTRVKPVQE